MPEYIVCNYVLYKNLVRWKKRENRGQNIFSVLSVNYIYSYVITGECKALYIVSIEFLYINTKRDREREWSEHIFCVKCFVRKFLLDNERKMFEYIVSI